MDGWDIISAEEIENLRRMVKETGVKNILFNNEPINHAIVCMLF
jgi:hypothetical protein